MFCEGTLLPLADLRTVYQSGGETVEDRKEAKIPGPGKGAVSLHCHDHPATGHRVLRFPRRWQARCEAGRARGATVAFTTKVEESESPENPLNLLLGAILANSDSTRGGSRMGQVTNYNVHF